MTLDFLKIKEGFDQFIVRPLNAFGLGGFVFDIEGETTTTTSADITDHYTEANEAIQDHIAIRPDRVVLRSYVGELVNRLDPNTNTLPQKVTRKLTVLNGYLPQLSKAATQLKNIFEGGLENTDFDKITSLSLNEAVDIWGLVKNLTPPISKQQQAYLFFKSLQQQKILVSVQTPWEFMTSMAIETIVSHQDEETRDITDFTITLKKFRTAQTIYQPFIADKYQSRQGVQQAGITQRGNTQGLNTQLNPSSTPSALPNTQSINGLPRVNVAPIASNAIDYNSLTRELQNQIKNYYQPALKVPIDTGVINVIP